MPRELTVAETFNGPEHSANGGYVCGLLAGWAAQRLGARVAVTLHRPPPLGTPLEVSGDGRRAHLWYGEELLATAAPSVTPIRSPKPVPAAVARAAERDYPGTSWHPFPTCFVCGTRRTRGNGLALAPGPVTGRTVACTWTPDMSTADAGAVPAEVVWSVLDCPGGWAAGPMRTPRVLIWLTAEILLPPHVDNEYVIVAELIEAAGPAFGSVSAVFGPGQTIMARAASRWLSLCPNEIER